jgi:hypothetical protein
MKKFILISCLAFLGLGAMAADLRQTAPPDDVGCSFVTPTICTVSHQNFGLYDYEFSWLSGATIAVQDCKMPEQVSTEAVETAKTSVQVRLAEFRWPGIKNPFICATYDTYKTRGDLGQAALHNYFRRSSITA